MIFFFDSFGKLWIMFLSVVAALAIVASGRAGWIFLIYSALIYLLMNLIICIGMPGFEY